MLVFQAVAQQPVAIALKWPKDLANYQDPGVFPIANCTAPDLEVKQYGYRWHAVTVVGYDIGSGVGKPDSFWIIKNSHGITSQYGGYVKLPMLPDGTAGACDMYVQAPVYPLEVNLPPEPPSKANKPVSPALPVSPGQKLSAQSCKDTHAECKSWAKSGDCIKK